MLDNIKQKLKDAPNKARDALKRAVIRTRRRSAAFRRAGGMRRVMDNLVDGVRNKQPRALITLGSAAAVVIAVNNKRRGQGRGAGGDCKLSAA